MNSIKYFVFKENKNEVAHVVNWDIFRWGEKIDILFLKKVIAISIYVLGPVRVESFVYSLEFVNVIAFSGCQDEVITMDSFYSKDEHVRMSMAVC